MPYLGRRGTGALVPVEGEHEDFETLAVDQFGRLYWCRAAIEKWTSEELAAVLVHEAAHVLRKHHPRLRRLMGDLPDPITEKIGGIAADLEINDDEASWPFALPERALRPATEGLPEHLLLEDYFGLLLQRLPGGAGGGTGAVPGAGAGEDGEDGAPGQVGQSQHGSGAGANPGRWEVGAPGSADGLGIPGRTAAQMEVLRRAVAEDIRRAAAKARGVGMGWRTWAASVLEPPKISWKHVFARLFRRAVEQRRGMVSQSLRRISKKTSGTPYIRPGWVRPVVTAAVVVDTSGSMTDEEVAAGLREVLGVARATGAPVDLIGCSTQAHRAGKVVRSMATMRLPDGGTDMRAGIETALRSRPRPGVVVVVTDGDTPWPERPIGEPMIVVLTTDAHRAGVPPWATVVVLDS